jgi:hypothetical protein
MPITMPSPVAETAAARARRVPIWVLFLPLAALTAVILVPADMRLYNAILSASAFTAMQYLLPSCRFHRDRYLCPLNWALMLFAVKLVVTPVILMWRGPALGTLESLPTRAAMEHALLIDTAAYLAFCIALRFIPSHTGGFWSRPAACLEGAPSMVRIAVFAALGAIGFWAAFGSLATLIEYFSNPGLLGEINEQAEGGLRPLAGSLLRPFVAFSFILLWSREADRYVLIKSRLRLAAVTLFAVCGIVITNLTYSFNRGAFVFPLVALLSVFMVRIRRIPPVILIAGASLLAVPLLLVSSYRSSSKPAAEVVEDGLASKELPDQIQLYANGPQFLGYFLEQTGWGASLYWGRTLVASVLDPVPMLGKGFRDSSGTYIFNRTIYNDYGYTDQIIPLQGELFINFHLPGVVAGFFALGLMIGEFQRRSQATQSAFAAFCINYVALWASMMVVWSLSVFAQILIYFCWPIYVTILSTYVGQVANLRRIANPPRWSPQLT